MQKNAKLYLLGTLAFCLFLTIILTGLGELVIRLDTEHEESIQHDILLNSGAMISQNILKDITHGIFVTETLEALLKSSNYQTDNFNDWGRQIVVNDSAASAVQLAPNGIVSYIFPLKGNEGAMGHNLLKDKRRDDGALKAVQTREITFVGPIKLIQNGKYAVIARKPVFRVINGEEKFWGFTIALMLVEDILPPEIHNIEKQGYLIKLEGDDPDSTKKPLLYISDNWKNKNGISMPVDVPNGQWTLKLEHAPVHNKYYDPFRKTVFFVALTISIYIFIQQFLLQKKQKEILLLNEKLTELSMKDELTDSGNRRAGMQLLDYQIKQSKRYKQKLSIAMIDIDYFKRVNDEHGHAAGDSVLRHLSSSLKTSLRKSNSIFRLGGDEFLIIFPQTNLNDCALVIQNMNQYIKNHTCKLDAANINLSLSIGIAEYITEESMESLLRRVDMKLYEAKDAGRNTVKY
ncbi:diguanylate cyclase [Desulfovibrio gilichinskyi]|uniref:diguanylate cyclase n=1 Tax=Desulfovibrio gilichinskyi TaxID=1519643 RepID=A0A1X7CUP0_9BACT|nr:diguanylate cyclase [Desulfovibrio gilichinskyi]SMF03405.1 diguanylate cyclase (GGDEF) domain-containing protein [Desulfovibrio gilichinskyi]